MPKYHVTVKQVIIYDCFRIAPDVMTAGMMALDNSLDDWEEDTEACYVETGEITEVTDEESISWGELAELTHVTQVQRFGFCSCEDNEGNENPYSDCPEPRVRVLREVEL